MLKCPKCNVVMIPTIKTYSIVYKSKECDIIGPCCVCKQCGFEASTVEQATQLQKQLWYQYNVGN